MTNIADIFSSLRIPKSNKETLKRHYSISGDFLMYQRCPRLYGMYVLRQYRPAKINQPFFGNVIHQTLDLAHHHYLGVLNPSLRCTIPTDQNIESYFLAAESNLRTQGIVPFGASQREAALNLLKRFNKNYGPRLYPRVYDTECKLQIDLGEVLIRGIVDVLMASHSSSQEIGIWDYKGTNFPSGKSMLRIMHDYAIQMRIYSLLYSRKFGSEPGIAVLVFLNELRSDPPSREEERRAFTRISIERQEREVALKEVMRTVGKIERERSKDGVAWHPPPLSMIPERQTCNTCDFRYGCESAISAYRYVPRLPKAIANERT